MWDRGSKGQYAAKATVRTVADDKVARFAMAKFGCCSTTPIYFYDHGDLPFLGLMHWEAARVDPALVTTGQPPLPPPPPPPSEYIITLLLAGDGSGDVIGAGGYPSGQVVTVSGTPDAGSSGPVWSGCGIPDPDNTLKLTVTANLTCTATFTLLPPPPPPEDREVTVNGVKYKVIEVTP